MPRRIFTQAGTAALVAMVLALCCPAFAQRQEGWFGTWMLQLPPSAEPYKRATTRIEPWQDGLKVAYDMVGTRGGVTHMEWTGRFDSKDYPMQGVDYVMTNAYRRIDDRSYEIVIKLDGQVTAIARVELSTDNRTLRVTTQPRSGPASTTVYSRK